MINFKTLTQVIHPKDAVLKIEGHPVWDYKAANFTVFLISQDPWNDSEDEFVSLDEIKKYIIQNEIPFDKVQFATEADREVLTRYEIKEDGIYFYH